MELTLTSSAFEEGQPLPRRYTAEGGDISPPLSWSNAPEGTREWVILCEDAEHLILDSDDPPGLTYAEEDRDHAFVHWLAYGIPSTVSSLPEGPVVPAQIVPATIVQGLNSFGSIGYRGPSSRTGDGTHRYLFRIFALDCQLNLPPGTAREELFRAMEGHLLNEGLLIAIYSGKETAAA